MNAPTPLRAAAAAAAMVTLLLAAGCIDNHVPAPASVVQPVHGTVITTWGAPVGGAVVYLVPVGAVSTAPITAQDVLDGSAADRDEPLEDALRTAAAPAFPQATTATDGTFTIAPVDTSQSFFPYVAVGGANIPDLLPGGDDLRAVRTGAALARLDLVVTGQPSAAATYVGSSTCLICHYTLRTIKTHPHRLGLRVPGVSGALQSLAQEPSFDMGLQAFVAATSATAKSLGTSLWFYDFDASRGDDKFAIATTDPGNAEIRAYLWQDSASSEYRITLENVVTPADPDRTFTVALTYGGALNRQLYLLDIGDPGYAGRYPLLQFQHEGDPLFYDRTRKPWRDMGMELFFDEATKLLQLPPKTSNVEARCFACHVTGYQPFDAATGERLCDGVDDQAGVFDVDGDSSLDEINVGCESCHGPGSEHIGFADPRAIVSPSHLSPSRQSMLCGRCHDRVAGNDDLHNGQPLNMTGMMPPPGISRADFLAQYTTQSGPPLSAFWPDGIHSMDYRQEYADFLKSAHMRNDRRLVTCSDCHDLHGQGAFEGELIADPSDGTLCQRCHAIPSQASHTQAKTGMDHTAASPTCLSCHFYPMAQSGAGRFGLLLGAPTGQPMVDKDRVYWVDDIASHLTDVPDVTNPGVKGVQPGCAMPIPYTNSCGVCHRPSLPPN